MFHCLQTLGKVGKVVKTVGRKVLRVKVEGETWTFNPECVEFIPKEEAGISSTSDNASEEEDSDDESPVECPVS